MSSSTAAATAATTTETAATTTQNTTTSSSSRNEAKPIYDDPKEAARKCEQWVASGVTGHPSIMFLLKTLLDAGCTPPDHFIRCAQCVQPQAGGFGMLIDDDDNADTRRRTTTTAIANNQMGQKTSCQRTAQDIREQLERAAAATAKTKSDNNNNNITGTTGLKLVPDIFVCQQYMEDEAMVHRTVHHELIHAIDLCRTNMDPVTNCVQLACTEIRAENLSGECRFWKELPKMTKFAGHGSTCVERRAVLSVRANPRCADRAEEYVRAALPRCSRDYYPYDRHPNEK
jgi:mitochondrial inner membrane protease ATP23